MSPALKLYSVGTPNGQKIAIFLKLLKQHYDFQLIDLLNNEQKQDWFLKMNPNGRVPVLSHTRVNGRSVFNVFESGAILQYLGAKFDDQKKYYYGPEAGDLYWEQTMWLTFQVASRSPIQGQAGHFMFYTKEDIPYAKKRYFEETKRVLGVYEIRLAENNGWLVGNKLNIADISAWPLVNILSKFGVSLDEWPLLKMWAEKIGELPEFKDVVDGI